MKNNNVYIICLLHIMLFLVGICLFVVLFHTSLFQCIDIFFYRGIVLLGVTCVSMIPIFVVLRRSRVGYLWTNRDSLLLLVILFSFTLVFFTHIPVTADRSISIFLLGHMNTHQDRVSSKEDITKEFIDTYVMKYDAIEKRLSEQVKSGMIQQEAQGYRITKQGTALMRFYAFIADLFGIDKKMLLP